MNFTGVREKHLLLLKWFSKWPPSRIVQSIKESYIIVCTVRELVLVLKQMTKFHDKDRCGRSSIIMIAWLTFFYTQSVGSKLKMRWRMSETKCDGWTKGHSLGICWEIGLSCYCLLSKSVWRLFPYIFILWKWPVRPSEQICAWTQKLEIFG